MSDMDSASPVLKLCDFGASRYLKEVQGNDAAESSLDRLTHYVGSRWYRAPELMGNRTEYDELVDVWSSGTIIAEMVTGAALFQGEDETQVIASVCKLLGALPVALARSLEQHGLPLPARPVAQGTRTLQKMCGAKLGPKGIAMLEGMLEPDASRRPSASRIAAHAYLCEDDPVRAWDLDDGHVLRPLVDAVKATDLASTDDANLDSRCRAVARSLLDAPVATVDAWLSTFAEGEDEAPCWEKLALMLQRMIDSVLRARVSCCKDVILSQHQADLTLHEVVDAVEGEMGSASKNEAECCAVCSRMLQRLHDHPHCAAGVGAAGALSTVAAPVPKAARVRVPPTAFFNSAINQLLSLVSALLLDYEATTPADAKAPGTEQLERLLGMPAILEHPALLTPTSKSIFLYLRLSRTGLQRLTLTTSRETAWDDCVALLQREGYIMTARAALGMAQSCVIHPYYKSPYGKKLVDGHSVEEGEGLGPRKELFALLSAHVQQQWRATASVRVDARPGEAVIRPSDKAGEQNRTAFADKLVVGCRVAVGAGGTAFQVTRVRQDGAVQVDRLVREEEALADMSVSVEERCVPLLVYHQQSEGVWLNHALARQDQNEQRLRSLGALMGLTIANQCQLDLRLPELFFHMLTTPGYSPARTELANLDAAFAAQINAVDTMADGEFSRLLVADALPSSMSRSAYIENAVAEHFSAVEWQLDALREGFYGAVPLSVLAELAPVAHDLSRIVCGARDDRPDVDFAFRKVFQVVMDAALQHCAPLHDAFWEVVDGLTPQEKRGLLLFVTGISKLPEAGTEFLTIEMPFMPYGLEEHRKMLAMIPQSHTCDNILELPNYWEALLKTRPPPSENDEQHLAMLREELRRVLKEKLALAIANAHGYGLDSLEGGGGGDDDDQLAPAKADPEDDATDFPEIPMLDDDSDLPDIPMLDDDSTKPTAEPSSSVSVQKDGAEDEDEYGDDEFEDDDFED